MKDSTGTKTTRGRGGAAKGGRGTRAQNGGGGTQSGPADGGTNAMSATDIAKHNKKQVAWLNNQIKITTKLRDGFISSQKLADGQLEVFSEQKKLYETA